MLIFEHLCPQGLPLLYVEPELDPRLRPMDSLIATVSTLSELFNSSSAGEYLEKFIDQTGATTIDDVLESDDSDIVQWLSDLSVKPIPKKK